VAPIAIAEHVQRKYALEFMAMAGAARRCSYIAVAGHRARTQLSSLPSLGVLRPDGGKLEVQTVPGAIVADQWPSVIVLVAVTLAGAVLTSFLLSRQDVA
jgi:hypothetical protein